MTGQKINKPGLLTRIRSFRADNKGVAAIEFAFVMPILLTMYFVTLEIGLAIESNKKIGRTASMVADLVTQNQTMTKAELDAIMRIGESTLQPYNRSGPEIRITAIQFNNDPTPKGFVQWSRKLVGTGGSVYLAKNTNVTSMVPEKLRIANSFLIRAESTLDYKPIITWSAAGKEATGMTSAFANINMGEVYHLRPRMSATIPCSDCD